MTRSHSRLPPRAEEFPPGEEWLELPLDARYLISTGGRLYSTVRRRILIPQWLPRQDAPPILYWRLGRSRRSVRSAHWVLSTFGPPRPSDWYVAACLDGDRGNVALDNLEWRPRLTNDQLRAISHARPVISAR